jgi:hypothetical protein
MGCHQVVRVGNNIYATLILNMETPQGCMLSSLLYSLVTYNCMAMHDSTTIIKLSTPRQW